MACCVEAYLWTRYGPRLKGSPAQFQTTIVPTGWRGVAMHPEDLMSGDLLSEILLLVSGSLVFVSLMLILVAALTQTPALL